MTNPLVSVVVVAYNASNTIVETLDSIKAQTYSAIELVISDDYSTDDTAEKCKMWLDENSGRFANSKLIVNEKNQGVSANLNIGIQASNGEWIKSLGDDVLLPDAIEKNITFAVANDSSIVASMVQQFVDETGEKLNTLPPKDYQFPISNRSQYLAALKGKIITPAPTWFYKRELYNHLGGFDEHFRLSEDVPFGHKLLEAGFCFSYLPEVTVLYRIKSTSLSHSKKLTGKQKQTYFESRYAVYREIQAPALRKNKLYATLIHKNLYYYFYKKKIYSRDHSLARYFYGALFTFIKMFS